MRRISHFIWFAVFLLSSLSFAHAASAQDTDSPPAKKITRIRQGGNITVKSLKYKVNPQYPEAARRQMISGTVRLHVIIARDGSVAQMEVISGDPILVQASLDAVRQWKYRVTLLNGEPVEVDTTIDVVFSLNR